MPRFFPLYPFTVRYLDRVLPGGDVFAALLMNFVLGFVAVLLVGLLARRLFDIEIAERSMVFMALFPGSFVLSFAYSEALMFVLVGVCLWALLRERWLLAGIAAAFVTASRPNGVAICFACAVASYLAIRHAPGTGGRWSRRRCPPSGGSCSRCCCHVTPTSPGCGSGCSARRGTKASVGA